ncbi:MAG: sodium:calcium antiporter [Spirochaetales bacterium]|nr:MAG: sodium:calcium antiporter [Spirochaetales bacterium]
MNFWTVLLNHQALETVFAGLPLWMLLLIVAVTITVLSKGADWMIDGAVSLALRTGMSQIIIGATILSLGTTMPEAFVSVMAAFMGNPGLALGNGVGSIIADTGMIFGLTALITAPPVNRRLLIRTGRWQIGSALLLTLLAALAFFFLPGEPVISRWMGIVLAGLLVFYMINTYRWARRNGEEDSAVLPQAEEAGEEVPASLFMALFMLTGGLILVIASSRLIVPSAGEIARRLRVPEDVIAATMVALGTSLPELSTAIAAMRKGKPEITIGNIVGADVLNVLFVIGAASLAEPLTIPPTFFRFHFPSLFIPVFYTK